MDRVAAIDWTTAGVTDRIEPRLSYRPELDAIRGAAMLIVLTQHFWLFGASRDNARAGQVGVTLFFVLSGYLITSLLLVEHRASATVAIRRFYIRRVRRLFPALAFMVVITGAAWMPGVAMAALTYTTNWYLQFGGDAGAYNHTWTLGIEEQFYLIWPVAFIVLAPRRRLLIGAIAALIVLAVLIRPIIHTGQRSDALLAGALLAILAPRVPSWVGYLGWAGVLVCAFVPGPVDQGLLSLATISSVAVVAAPGRIRFAPFVRIGTLSYGAYLWSFPIALIAVPKGELAWTVAGVVATFAMALLSERFVERRWRVSRQPTSRHQTLKSAKSVPGVPVFVAVTSNSKLAVPSSAPTDT